MQWRMVGRRGRGATWTIVGDPAQSSWPVPAEAEAARSAALGEKAVHAFHLSKNYRNSAEIYASPPTTPSGSASPPTCPTRCAPPAWTRASSPWRTSRRASWRRSAGCSAGSRAPSAWWSRWPGASRPARWLAASPYAEHAEGGDRARVAVLTGLDTKGLEFDGIVVVEPGEIEAESPTGRATLYVVYTRATQQMVTLGT